MNRLDGVNAISGREGRAYAKIDGNNEEMFFARRIEAGVEKTKATVKALCKRMAGHKTIAVGSSAIAMTAVDILTDPSLLGRIRDAFAEMKARYER